MRGSPATPVSPRTPQIGLTINGVDYSSRVLFIEHHEEPYRDWATILLNNADRGLDSVATAGSNLLGSRFRIAYGYTGVGTAETADLWVKAQQMVTAPGQLVCQLYCEGQWAYLREQQLMALGEQFAIVDPADVGSDPYYSSIFNATKTVYELIELIIEGAFGWTLNAAPADPTLSFKPVLSLKKLPNAATVLRDLISMTSCYLRPKANLIWDIVYPQAADGTDATYYSGQHPYFNEYAESLNLVIPNRIVVFAGNPEGLPVWPEPVIVGDSGAYSGNYVEVMEPQLAPTIIAQADANARANAILDRYTAEQLSGYLIVPHDCRIELYDKPSIVDNRGL